LNPLGIHSFCWLGSWSSSTGERAAAAAAAHGYTRLVVPIRDPADIDPPAIHRLCDANGIRPIATSNQLANADIGSEDAETRRLGMERHRLAFRLARDMGAAHVGGVLYGPLGRAPAAATARNRQLAAESLHLLAEEAGGMGLPLAIEVVNRYESNLVNTVAQGLEMLREAASDNLFLHIDTFHMNIEEPDTIAAITAALPRLLYFELDQNHRGLPTEGALDFAPMLACLKAHDYRGTIGVESFTAGTATSALQTTLGLWRDLYSSGDEVAAQAMMILRDAGFAR
jgi:D-psicose/D-tagatose/L-ribulose 3-epimerase